MAAGNYATVSRKKMLEYLAANANKTVNVQDIHKHLCENDCGVNITTIYRFMDKLTKEGRVMKYASEDGSQAVYQYVEPSSHCDEHLHLQCVKCGTICHLDYPGMEEFTEQIKKKHGFCIQCKNSIIYGVCEKCEKRMKP